MRRYKPQQPFNTAMKLLTPKTEKVKGVTKKTYETPEDVFYGSFRTFGGSENTSNGVYTVYDTAIIDTWYRPDIQSDCRIKICETDEVYEVIGRPENIDMRNKYMQVRVEKVGGKA